MPHQNRVTPFNELIATPARGSLMGNRGVLHDGRGRIVRPFAHRNWVTCVLEFKGRHRQVMTPGRYTHLFFLDEATALAAGHRPCGECRRADYVRFKEAWATVHGLDADTLKAGEMDGVLHPERVAGQGKHRHKPTFTTTFGSIPDGVMFHQGEGDPAALLKWMGRAWVWSPERYGGGPVLRQGQRVEVLTPKGVVAINPRGTVYTPDNVKEALATRNLMQELREEGTMSGGPPPLGPRDREKFANAIDRELTRLRRDSP